MNDEELAEKFQQLLKKHRFNAEHNIRCGTMLMRSGAIKLWNGHESQEAMHKAQGTLPSDFTLMRCHHNYQITRRPAELGDGWRLQLSRYGEEAGDSVFLPQAGVDLLDAWIAARDEGEAWIAQVAGPNRR